jgi:hypothetical protein
MAGFGRHEWPDSGGMNGLIAILILTEIHNLRKVERAAMSGRSCLIHCQWPDLVAQMAGSWHEKISKVLVAAFWVSDPCWHE